MDMSFIKPPITEEKDKDKVKAAQDAWKTGNRLCSTSIYYRFSLALQDRIF